MLHVGQFAWFVHRPHPQTLQCWINRPIWNAILCILNSKRNVVILNRRHNSTTRVLHVSFSGNMQSNIILNHDCAWKSYRGMECDLNGFQSIRYVNGHVDILYSYDVSFAVQYTNILAGIPYLWTVLKTIGYIGICLAFSELIGCCIWILKNINVYPKYVRMRFRQRVI